MCLPTIFFTIELLLNATIEERVSLLEIQVVEIQEDLTELDEDVTLLEGDVNFLFEEQIIQDERLLILEQDSDVFDDEIESECIIPNSLPQILLQCNDHTADQIVIFWDQFTNVI